MISVHAERLPTVGRHLRRPQGFTLSSSAACAFRGSTARLVPAGASERLERDDVLAVGQQDATDRDLVHLADHRKGVVPHLGAGAQVVRSYEIAGVDGSPARPVGCPYRTTGMDQQPAENRVSMRKARIERDRLKVKAQASAR